ncbi:hypothetical protein B0H14DRAFT_3578224 [Mycena olivaceomarginata]|nr:hypothetical protein B0H14DRAFT_3578224 [Mycena olivaceomarginata]
MARNSQRQSTAARKVRETRDAADTSKQLQLQIDAEVEKHRASSQLTKDLRAQLKAAKRAQTTVLPTQSDHVPTIPSAISEPSVTEFDVNTPTASEPSVTEDVHIPTASEPSVTEFDTIFPCTIHRGLHRPGIRFNIRFHVDFEFNTLLSDVEHLTPSAGFGTSVPDSGSMFDNPLTTSWTCTGSQFFSDPIGTSDFSPFAPSDPCRYFLPLRRIHLWALPPQRKNQPRVPRSRVVGLGTRLMKPTA